MVNMPNADTALSDAELDRLELLLGSDDMPETVMDISMLDGFFTALLSGPNLVMPTQALRWIWDSEDGKAQPRFQDKPQAEELMALLMRYWNTLAATLSEHPDDYAPLIYMDGEGDEREAIIEEWCSGYVLGLAQDPKGWAPMLEEPSDELSLIMLYGTEEGWAQLGDQQLDDAYHREAADALADCAVAIYAYWRQAKVPPIRNPAKVGRNDACPCGSGKKYKLCHGAPATNEA